jgi:tetratricopeptide (TPR) repeat protein
MQRFLLITVILSAACLGCTAYNNNTEGVKYFGQARYDLAVKSFETARDADPNAPDAYYNIAATHHQLGRTALQTAQAALAQQHFDYADQNHRACLARKPNDADAYRGLAVLYMERQDHESAFKLLQSWVDANPNSAEPKIEHARLYQEYASIAQAKNNTETAQQCMQSAMISLQNALTLEPANARALRAMGFLREQSGDVMQAMYNYRQSLQLNPNQKDLAERVAQLEKTPGLGANLY